MRWASAISTTKTLEEAAAEALSAVAVDLAGSRPDLILLYVTDHFAASFAQLTSMVVRRFPGATVAGCTAGGAIGGGLEVEHRPALAIVAASLPGVSVRAMHLTPDHTTWPEADHTATAVLVMPCPLTCPLEELLAWTDDEWPRAVKIGGLASGGMTARGPAGNTLFLGDTRHREGAVVVTFDGDVSVDTIVAQGCRPIGEPMLVSKGLGNVVLELDGVPALRALEAVHARLDPADRALCRHSLFVGTVPGRAPTSVRRRDVLIRNLIGCDRAAGALAIGAPVHVGQVMQFHLRDATTSAQDLAELLAEPHAAAAGALLFSCVGRGQLLYGRPNHDSDAFQRALGPVPLGGFFCNGEVGPVGGRTYMHGYTSAFGLFRRRGAQA
ncbi:MAG TPA: FIST N-terminal domain-containing protein [Kofleriaceae bacterium]|jgi:small ligand-binding sensory domain FIST|nr:FIST N-terminal domain-containing protein [Kofleriaceae bacterium]